MIAPPWLPQDVSEAGIVLALRAAMLDVIAHGARQRILERDDELGDRAVVGLLRFGRILAFLLGGDLPPGLVVEVLDTRGEDRPAMHAAEQALVAEVVEVLTDRLRGDSS